MDWLYPPRCCNCDRQGFVFCDACFAEINPLSGNLCQKCGYPTSKKNNLCEDCQFQPPPFTSMRSWSVYSGSLQQAIHAFKYKRNLALARTLAKPIVEMVKKSDWEIDLVVPVPLSLSRYISRGYNQAALLSWELATQLNIQHSTSVLKRIKNTSRQIEMDVNKRFTNLLDAFYANPATLKKRNVLIIDDVITTGSTMQNCTRALLNAGAEKIYCVSVARAILRHERHHQGFASNSV
jgi:competence protein ComFC